MRRALAWLAALAMACAVEAAAAGVALQWQGLDDERGRGEVVVDGLPPAAIGRLSDADLADGAGEALLRVVVAPPAASQAAIAALPALWGEWTVEGDALVFRPRHAPAPGMRLRARFDGAAFDALAGSHGTPDAESWFEIPASANVARVTGLSPGGDTLPQNLLRLYVEFSQPMSLRDVERHVRLLDADGVPIPQAFASPADGLWDPQRRRLTLIVHPGRVKSGLALGDALGPVLAEGSSVTLVIDAAMRDADGGTLVEAFSHTWRIAAPVRKAIDLARWRLQAPAGGREPLRIHTPQALDRALAPRMLAVVATDGTPWPGALELLPGERELHFRPQRPWQRGARYRLVASPMLEDASGNRPARVFERDIAAPPMASSAASEIEFVVPATR